MQAVVSAGFLLLLLNAAYLAAWPSPTVFYMANALLHLALGTALLAGLGFLYRRAPAAAAFFLAAALAAGYLVIRGNTAEHRWVLWLHIAAAAGGLAAMLPYVARRAAPAFRLGFYAALVLLAVVPLAGAAYRKFVPDPRDRIANPTRVPASMDEEGGGPRSPFFPSSARTSVGGIIPANFFMDSEACGECHKDIYEQWKSSAHHFASFNNQFYRKSIEYMQSVVGTRPSKWCAGCHDHAVFFNGRFEKPALEQIDTPEAHAGLACTSCHSIVHVDSSMGNGGFTIEYPPLHELATSKNRYARGLHYFLTYLNPRPHKRAFLKPFMRDDAAEFCSTCHKVHLDVPVNSYRWIRGFNDYDNWQASGVSGQGARSFYYPDKSSNCVDCHMPLVASRDPGHHHGKVHSHRFPGANTALAHVNRDDAQMAATRALLQSGFITVDIFAVSPVREEAGETPMVRRAGESPGAMSTFAVGEEAEQAGPVTLRPVGEMAAPLDRVSTRIPPGSTVRVDVVARTRRIGHFFPGGTVDAFDVWLELQARDAGGRVFFWSGRVEDDGRGPVEPGAHFYRAYLLDAAGNPINKRNAWQARSTLYVRLIPPGAADVAHYRVKIPGDARGPVTLTARLNYRKFSHYYTQFAYAGRPAPGQDASLVSAHSDSRRFTFLPSDVPPNVSGRVKGAIPDLPVVTLAQAETALRLGEGEPQWQTAAGREDRERWNDWGIGLLLQGDLKGAEYAFRKVTEAEPGYADGWLNVARALIQEGETEAAKPYIRRALEINPDPGRIHFFKALIEKADGDYDAALRSLEKVAARYPRDRVALNQMGRILFLQRRYAEAVRVLERVCAVDPEDLQMHYTLMLCYRGLGEMEKAAREQKLFERFKADEASQAITAVRRRISPEDNNERQPIHEHVSVGGLE
ncbi:MAG: tetratricopeptide repeat protein [Bryobacterales bacterium]|nr:tetratricopeptide repeat protein [Bryobacterales bacterium]